MTREQAAKQNNASVPDLALVRVEPTHSNSNRSFFAFTGGNKLTFALKPESSQHDISLGDIPQKHLPKNKTQ